VGKELVARAIHQASPRRVGPFICLNCAALTETLLESELFGHEKGAFTGATERMIGKFEAADGGTIFLDEIGEMALSTQAKFLRVLEGHPFERVGGNVQIKVDVRVVAATNRPLEDAVRAGTFRRDLFYRLQVVQLDVPPLRDRLDDVPALAEHFLKKFVRETGRKIKGFTDAAMDKLKAYKWPGNVRELKNVIERAVILCDEDAIYPRHLHLSFRPGTVPEPVSPWDQIDLSGTLLEATRRVTAEVERRKVEQAMKDAAGSRQRAAEQLQISFKSLVSKLKEFGISES
jgi:Nif-specific regulatory protein